MRKERKEAGPASAEPFVVCEEVPALSALHSNRPK